MSKNIYNYNKLQARMVEKGYTQKTLAKELKKNEGTISAKFNNESDFKTSEMCSICEILEIPLQDIGTYFFTT